MNSALEVHDLVKQFPGFTLGPLSFTLEPGVVVGFVGPNGAGKTTTMDLLAGLLHPTRGCIKVFGRQHTASDATWKQDLGYVSERQPFFEDWSGEQNLHFLSRYYPTWSTKEVHELVMRFSLPIKKKVRALSKGNRVKLSLIAALAHHPKLLLLDEPTAGLDPVVRAEFQDVLWERLRTEEFTILYSTHILSDISRMADDLIFLRDGTIVVRSQKELLLENWRQISFRPPVGWSQDTLLTRLNGHVVTYQAHGKDVLIISDDFRTTTGQLKELGAEVHDVTRLGIDDIAVHILKGAPHVAPR